MNHARVAITDYCERVDDTFWAEPVNAITNLVFLLTAIAIIRVLRQHSEPFYQFWDLWLLTGLLSAVGVGSFLWHTYATAWAELADVVPIMLFLGLYLISFLVRITGLKPAWVLFWLILFLCANYFVHAVFSADLFNGSVFYLPALMSLAIMTIYCNKIALSCRNRLMFVTLIFSISLVFRTIDQHLCPAWPLGTHFIWHVLNGVVLYLGMGILFPGQQRAENQPIHNSIGH
jgi:hypothetical protein